MSSKIVFAYGSNGIYMLDSADSVMILLVAVLGDNESFIVFFCSPFFYIF